MAIKTFILSDESVNEYGFRLLMAGGKLDKFKNNPVMLFNHRDYGDGYEGPVGKWDNIRIEGGKLMADPSFDMEDDKAKRLSGKVDRGYLKGASLGFNIIAVSSDPSLMLQGQTMPTVTEWEPFEASVVDIPGNANCLMLRYNGESVLVKQQSDLSKLSIFQSKPTINSDMDKFPKALLEELGLAENANEAQVNEAIKTLKKGKTDAEATLKTQRDASIKNLIDTAKLKKGLDEKQAESLTKLAGNDFDLAQKTIDLMPDKKTLKSQVETSGNGGVADERKDWTMRDWEKKDPKGLLKLKTEDKDAYQELFNKTYKK
ncbi:MAG: hypothetical protein AB7G44_03405 [Bacteroidia bacterium]